MEVLGSRVVSGAPQCVGVSEILLVPPGDIVTAAGPSIPSSQDSILLSRGGGGGVGGEGKLTAPYSSLGRLGHMTPWTNNWHREGNFHEGLRPGEIHIQPGLCEGGTGTGAHSQPAGPAVQSCSGNGHSSVEQQGEKV